MRKRLSQAIFITFVVGLVAAGLFVPHAGQFLVVEDPFVHAEVALVLSGLPISRSFAARDLYHQGRVDRIVVIPEPPSKLDGEVVKDQLRQELISLRLVDPTLPQWSERILVATGVPRERITVLPQFANGTIEEAERVWILLHGRLPKSLVLITSKSASRRARMIFRRVFKHDPVQIFSYPTPYDWFEPVRWWSQPRNALAVVTEYQKLLVNVLNLLLGPSERR